MKALTPNTMTVEIHAKEADFAGFLVKMEDLPPLDRYDMEASIFYALATQAKAKAKELRHG